MNVYKKNEIKMLIFSVCVLIFAFLWDYFVRSYREFDFFIYYTHLSIIFVILYLSISVFFNNKKIIVLTLPAITLTGILYMSIMFFCNYFIWISWIVSPSLNPYNINSLLYFFTSSTLTLMMHLVIPTFFYKLTKNEFKNNTTLSKSIVVSIFFMIVYFIFVETVLFTIGGIGIKDTAPYFFLELRDINTLMLVVDIMVYIIIVELMININFFLIR